MPRQSSTFVPPLYDNREHTRRMSDLMRYASQQQADLALRKGDIAANLGANLANIAGQTIQGITQYYGEKPQREAAALEVQQRKDAMGRENAIRDVTRLVPPGEDGRPNLKQIAAEIQKIDPEKAMAWYQAADEQTKQQVQLEHQRTESLARFLVGFDADAAKMPPPARQEAWSAIRQQAIDAGVAKAEDIPQTYSPAFTKTALSAVLPLKELLDYLNPQKEGFTLNQGQTRFDAQGNKIADVPKTEEAYTLSPGQTRFGPDGKPLANVPKPEEAYTLSPGSVRYGPDGKVIARVPSQGPAPSYEWAIDPRDGVTKLMSPQEIRGIGGQQPPTADMRNKEAGKRMAGRAVSAVKDLGSRIITKVGPAQRADAIKRGAEAVFGNDPEFRTYQDSRMALAGTLAVEQQGARVSDADVKALWLPMVPDAYRDTSESYKLKWELIDAMRGGGAAAAPKPPPAPPKAGGEIKVGGFTVRKK